MSDTMEMDDEKQVRRRVRRVRVSVCSGSDRENVQGFIREIRETMSDEVESVTFVSLPYNISDLNIVNMKGIEVMVLCHSIHNRRFSITDVTDSLYDTFLLKANKKLGKDKVCVIAHDFPTDDITPGKLEARMVSFRCTQRTTFLLTALALIAGTLDKTPEMTDEQKALLREFFQRAALIPDSLLDRVINFLISLIQRLRNCMASLIPDKGTQA